MVRLPRVLKCFFSFNKYPRYIVDCYIYFVLQFVWRLRGIILGRNISYHGIPIITIIKGSSLSLGARSVLCSRSTQTALGVNHSVIIRTLSPDAHIWIGSRVRMSGTTICAATKIHIGDRCVVGTNVTIVDSDFHSLDPLTRSSTEDSMHAISRPVTIGNDVFIGANSIIGKGVRVGDGAIIGAKSMVTQNVSKGMIVAGNPARIIGQVSQKND